MLKNLFIEKKILFFFAILICITHFFYIYEFSSFFYHEGDDRWWVPVIFERTKSLNFIQLLSFLFTNDAGGYSAPIHRIQPYLIIKLLGITNVDFTFASLLLHTTTSFFIFKLTKVLNFNYKISLFSSVIHFTFFNHFHAYIHAISFQHQLFTFFLISILYFYFKTNKLKEEKGKFEKFYIVTLFMMLLSCLSRNTIIIIPILIYLNIFNDKNLEESKKKFFLWLPSFIIYAVLCGYFISINGEDQIWIFNYVDFLKFKFPFNFLIITSIFSLTILVSYYLIKSRNIKKFIQIRFLILFLFFLTIYLIGLENLLSPLISFTNGFFLPFSLEMSTRSGFWSHRLPTDFQFLYIATAFLIIFIYINKNKNDLFNKFFIWAFLYLVLCITFPRNFTDIDSRYFYYFSPFLIIIFSSVLVYSLEVIPNKILKNLCFFILLIVLSIQSTLTIKVSMLRGKMSANRHIYDYVKFSKNISGILNNHKIKKIYVKNLPKLNLDKEQPENFFGKKFNNGELEFLTLKYILNQDYPKIKISENFTSSENTKIFDFNTVLKQGSFDLNFQKSKNYFIAKDYGSAEIYLDKSIESRPFLLNFLLGSLDLGYLRFITDRLSLSGWLLNNSQIFSWSNGSENLARKRVQYISSLAKEDLLNYQEAILLKIFLNYEKNKYINHQYISKLSILDNDKKNLVSIVNKWQLDLASKENFINFLSSYKFDLNFYLSSNYHKFYQNNFEKFIFRISLWINEKTDLWVSIKNKSSKKY